MDFWLDRMKLAEWKMKKTTDLSKGMSQKVQFISTVLHNPDLLILDEPFSGLDPVNVEFMIEVVAELKAQHKTIIFSRIDGNCGKALRRHYFNHKSRKVIGGTLREVKEGFGKT